MSMTPLKDLVEYMAKALVDNPDQVEVHEVDGEQTTVIELKVAKEDLGKVIGRGGKIANSIRAVVNHAAAAEGVRAMVDFTS